MPERVFGGRSSSNTRSFPMTRLVLLENDGADLLRRLLESLGAFFERSLSLEHALNAVTPEEGASTALILSEERLFEAQALARQRAVSILQLFSGFRNVLVYPFRGSREGLTALSEWLDAKVEIHRLEGPDLDYHVKRLSLCGSFSGLKFGPANPAADFGLSMTGVSHPIESIVEIGQFSFFTKVSLTTTELFICSTSAIFDVGREFRHNLQASTCFAGLVPLIFFLRYCAVPHWQTPRPMANIVIDDPDLKTSYGFLDSTTLARCVDDLECAVAIGFIPWNFKRTSPAVVELFRSRWPRLSLCIHGCDHMKEEFCSSVAQSQRLISLALKRMQRLRQRTGLDYDRVMVFPRGEFSAAAMQALRGSAVGAAVNTELIDSRGDRGVSGGALLQPAITAYSGFPLFLRRPANEPIANFALDLLLGKPCLVAMHHPYFQGGPERFVSLVESLGALDPELTWSNLEDIVAHTYSLRSTFKCTTDVRLFSGSSSLLSERSAAQASFSKKEMLPDKSFLASVDGREIECIQEDEELRFSANLTSAGSSFVEVKVSPIDRVQAASHSLSYRLRVAGRRYFCWVRDNYFAESAWATSLGRRSEKASLLAPELENVDR
jgi:hypothetical protein